MRQALQSKLMSLRSAVIMGITSLMVFGCATHPPAPTADARLWREQLERQQQGARDNGRIGYIGYDGPGSQ